MAPKRVERSPLGLKAHCSPQSYDARIGLRRPFESRLHKFDLRRESRSSDEPIEKKLLSDREDMNWREDLEAAAARARTRRAGIRFRTSICSPDWNSFIEHWAPISAAFVSEALAGFQLQPLPDISAVTDAAHAAGANASFNPSTGEVRLHPDVVEGKIGTTLEKLTHEFVHAALNDFPAEEDPFYTEGFVDYSVWVLAHSSIWGPHREAMKEAAKVNIANRRDRAMRDTSDYDRKRWAGGVFAEQAHGPWIVARLRHRKLEGNITW